MRAIIYIFQLSYKNIFRNPKRLLTLFLMIVSASSFCVWNFNFSKSGHQKIAKNITRTYTGTYQVAHKDYHLTEEINPYALLKDSPSSALLTRIIFPLFLSGSKQTRGVLLVGVDPEKESTHMSWPNALIQGKALTDSDLPAQPLLLGKKLALTIGAKINDQIPLISQALDGSMAQELFTVVGLLDFGGGDMEMNLAFTPQSVLRSYAAIPQSHYHIAVHDSLPVKKPTDSQIYSWRELIPDVAVTLDFINVVSWIVAIILTFLISFGIINALFLSFVERIDEFKLLRILGSNTRQLKFLMAGEILMIAFPGIITGLIAGNILTYYFQLFPLDLTFFTQGQPIMMGGMSIPTKIALDNHLSSSLETAILLLSIILLLLSFPLWFIIHRSKQHDS